MSRYDGEQLTERGPEPYNRSLLWPGMPLAAGHGYCCACSLTWADDQYTDASAEAIKHTRATGHPAVYQPRRDVEPVSSQVGQ